MIGIVSEVNIFHPDIAAQGADIVQLTLLAWFVFKDRTDRIRHCRHAEHRVHRRDQRVDDALEHRKGRSKDHVVFPGQSVYDRRTHQRDRRD